MQKHTLKKGMLLFFLEGSYAILSDITEGTW